MPDKNFWILGTLRIEEPMVTLTDILVTIVCIVAFYAVKKQHKTMAFHFLLMGIATFLGGIAGHALLYALPFSFKLLGWLPAMFSVYFLEVACIQLMSNENSKNKMQWFAIAKLIAFVVINIFDINFIYTTIHSALGFFIIIVPITIKGYFKEHQTWAKYFLVAITIYLTTAFAFAFKWIIHPWFNHLCLGHLLMAISAFYFFKGAKYLPISNSFNNNRTIIKS